MVISFTINDAVAASGLTRSRLYQLMAEGALEHRKIGKRTLILAESLRRLIEDAPPAPITPKSAA